MYEITLLKNGVLEIRHRDGIGNTNTIQTGITEAIPMIFEAANVICKSRHFEAIAGYGEFHALIKTLRKRGELSN